MSHRFADIQPPKMAKALQFDELAIAIDLRIATVIWIMQPRLDSISLEEVHMIEPMGYPSTGSECTDLQRRQIPLGPDCQEVIFQLQTRVINSRVRPKRNVAIWQEAIQAYLLSPARQDRDRAQSEHSDCPWRQLHLSQALVCQDVSKP